MARVLNIEKDLIEARTGLAKHIRDLRKTRKWTQQELAYQSGIIRG